MTLADDLDLEEYITAKDDLSGADIKVLRFISNNETPLLINVLLETHV